MQKSPEKRVVRLGLKDATSAYLFFIRLTELPYQVNKAKLLEKIAQLVREKAVEGITDLRDESEYGFRAPEPDLWPKYRFARALAMGPMPRNLRT